MAPHTAAYPFGEVVTLTGCTRRQLAHWVAIGIVTPAIREAEGTGHQRLFGVENLVEVRIAKLLSDFRITAETIRGVVGNGLQIALSGQRRYLAIDRNAKVSPHTGPVVRIGAVDQVDMDGCEAMIVIDLLAVREGLQRKGVVALPS